MKEACLLPLLALHPCQIPGWKPQNRTHAFPPIVQCSWRVPLLPKKVPQYVPQLLMIGAVVGENCHSPTTEIQNKLLLSETFFSCRKHFESWRCSRARDTTSKPHFAVHWLSRGFSFHSPQTNHSYFFSWGRMWKKQQRLGFGVLVFGGFWVGFVLGFFFVLFSVSFCNF